MPFEFATSRRILFGEGVAAQIPDIAAQFGTRIMLITGRNPERSRPIHAAMQARGLAVTTFSVGGEPSLEDLGRGLESIREFRPEAVVSVGGGSVIDLGKALAALAVNPGDPLDYLEVVGRANPLTRPPLPFLAVPTTAGTGAEVTRNAVLQVPSHRVKVSLRSPLMLPTVAIIDPELTYSMSPAVTAATGLDALAQVVEPFLSCKANPLTDGFCREGLRRVGTALPTAFRCGADVAARRDMALVSLYGGLALANAGLGAAHGFAGPIGGQFAAPHGALCACLLPAVLLVNQRALAARQPDSPALPRFTELARLVSDTPTADVTHGISFLSDLTKALQIPGLGTYGITRAHFPDLIVAGRASGSMKGNPISLTDAELEEILARSL